MAILFGRAQFTLVRGTRWADDISLTDRSTGEPVDLTGITGLIMRIREDIADTDNLMELSTDNTRLIVIEPTEGLIGIRVTSEDTRDFPENDHEKARYVYDALIQRTSDEYEAALGGAVFVLPQITRPWEAE
jgi:hypothetical protein